MHIRAYQRYISGTLWVVMQGWGNPFPPKITFCDTLIAVVFWFLAVRYGIDLLQLLIIYLKKQPIGHRGHVFREHNIFCLNWIYIRVG